VTVSVCHPRMGPIASASLNGQHPGAVRLLIQRGHGGHEVIDADQSGFKHDEYYALLGWFPAPPLNLEIE
jgi:hypothetical protein